LAPSAATAIEGCFSGSAGSATPDIEHLLRMNTADFAKSLI
jgi:hypothetical protein